MGSANAGGIVLLNATVQVDGGADVVRIAVLRSEYTTGPLGGWSVMTSLT